jgi:2-dehydro-3-deoxyphosphogluconate aldolase/(4S)-4-hydroxy-2-oxoglutarate aldolase
LGAVAATGSETGTADVALTRATRDDPPANQEAPVAVLRSADASGQSAVARALARGGVTRREITLRTPSALDAVAEARHELRPEAAIGTGAVVTGAQARDALAAGA